MIYVACPAKYSTGGVELLHQLCAEIRKYADAVIWYANAYGKDSPQMPEYDIYGNEYVTGHIAPTLDDVVILPEIWASAVWHLPRSVIYWESVDNYVNRFGKEVIFPENTVHIVQSYYARQFLKRDDVIDVTDYLNDDFFIFREPLPRDIDIIYNPAKGMEFTRKIMREIDGVTFFPMSGMSRNVLINTMRRAKLYIDFGDHPGKDRMPREAAICGCCVITGRNGAAAFQEDVGIPEEYKFDRREDNIPAITKEIRHVLDTFPTDDFEPYRETIRGEKERFTEGVKQLVERLEAR